MAIDFNNLPPTPQDKGPGSKQIQVPEFFGGGNGERPGQHIVIINQTAPGSKFRSNTLKFTGGIALVLSLWEGRYQAAKNPATQKQVEMTLGADRYIPPIGVSPSTIIAGMFESNQQGPGQVPLPGENIGPDIKTKQQPSKGYVVPITDVSEQVYIPKELNIRPESEPNPYNLENQQVVEVGKFLMRKRLIARGCNTNDANAMVALVAQRTDEIAKKINGKSVNMRYCYQLECGLDPFEIAVRDYNDGRGPIEVAFGIIQFTGDGSENISVRGQKVSFADIKKAVKGPKNLTNIAFLMDCTESYMMNASANGGSNRALIDTYLRIFAPSKAGAALHADVYNNVYDPNSRAYKGNRYIDGYYDAVLPDGRIVIKRATNKLHENEHEGDSRMDGIITVREIYFALMKKKNEMIVEALPFLKQQGWSK